MFRTASKNHWRIRGDLESQLVVRLATLAREEPATDDFEDTPPQIEAYRSTLEGYLAVAQTYRGPAFYFPERLASAGVAISITPDQFDLASAHFGWLADEYEARAPAAGVVVDDVLVSLCCSSVNPIRAAEASLNTAEPARGRGYAPQVVALWADLVRQSGRTPLYSTEWSNTASRRVAAKLGLQLYGEDLFLT